ncbi:MAG: M20/M25/M40 family metallo-hydrolase [Mucilaginibacter sp.]
MKKITLSTFLMLLLCSFNQIFAQQEAVDTVAFNKIRDAEMKSSQIPSIAHYLTDVSGSRLTNSDGFRRAGSWAIGTMKKWGLANAGFEPWGEYGRGWDVESFSIMMKVPYTGYIIGYPVPWSASTNGEIHAPVYQVLINDLMDSAYLEKHKSDFKGKIILLTNSGTKHDEDFKPFSTRLTDSELMKMPDTYMLTYKQLQGFLKPAQLEDRGLLALKSAGALAVVDANGRDRDGTVGVQGFFGYKTSRPEFLPEATLSSEDGFKIKRLLASGHPVELALNIKARFYSDDTKGYNVVAEIPGSDPKLKAQVVMLGGHLDSWNAATGATDNGAGCIVMMEVVRLLDSLHLQPKRTIRIVLWSGEEQGLLGSYNYVKNHFGNAETGVLKPEQAKMSAYFNLDNGTGKIRGIYAQGNTAVKPLFEQWLVPFHSVGAKTVTMSNTGSTDHLSFDWVGIPGFQFIQDPLDYESKTHHTNMDTYDYLQIDDLKQAAIIVASFVYQAGNRAELLPRKPLVKEKFVFDGL